MVFDPGGDLQNYQEHCELLIRDKGVRHIVGCYTSASRKQVLPLIERYDRLLWHSARYEGFENSDNVIYVGAAPNQHVVPLARHMIETLGTSVYCVGANYLWTWETNRVLQEIVTGGRRRDHRQAPGRAGTPGSATSCARSSSAGRPSSSTPWWARRATASIAICIAPSPASSRAAACRARPS